MPSLSALLVSDIEVAAVVTNPDRPAGRGMAPRPSPIKQAAASAELEVLQPESARDPALAERLAELAPDFAIVVAYGKILPADLLAIPRLGFVNLHFSLLPAYRGAAPVQRAVMDDRDSTGVSIMVLTEGMDEGPVLATLEEAIGPDDTAGELGARLSERGAPLLVDTVLAYGRGELQPVEQDHHAATYAPKLSPEETRISWAVPARQIKALVRAANPVPGAWTTLQGKRLKLWVVDIAETGTLSPGAVSVDTSMEIGTAEGAVRLVEAQIEGKRRMTGAELARGLRIPPGERVA